MRPWLEVLVAALAALLIAAGAQAGVKTAGVGHFQIPTAPSAGTSVTSGAANTYTTSAVQLIASTVAALYITGVYAEEAAVSAATYKSVQLMIGTAGSETVIGQYLISPSTGSTVTRTYRSIFPPIPVAASTRIAVKTADSAGALATLISLEVIAQTNVVDDGIAIGTVTTVTNQLTAAQVATGVWQDTTAGDFTTALSVGKSVMNGVALGTGLTVNTVTNQLTAAQVATGVWQDATAGDFTTASSIGKTLYIANVAPGGSGGLIISGTNAGTTTLGALTITGATTHTGATVNTGNVSYADGITIAAPSTANRAGITVTGNGTAAGVSLTGGAASGANAAGAGLLAAGGAASTTGGGVSAAGLVLTGGAGAASTNGAAAGFTSTAGGTTTVSGNDGVIFTGTSNGHGLTAAHAGTGKDLNATTTPLTLAKTTNLTGLNDIAATAVVSSGAITTSGGAVSTVSAVTGLTASNLDATVSSRMATYTQPTGFLAATFPSGTIANTTNITAGTIATVTTVTNQLTAAAIATGVWTDTTAGDFTTSASIGKSVMNGVALGTGLTVNDLTTKTGFSLAASQHVIVDSGTVTTLTNLPSIPANWLTAAGINAGALNGKGDWLLASSYTAPTNLTAAQIATGVWQDTTAGDFTTALSVGKSIMNGVSLGTGLTVASVSGSVGSVTGAVGSVTGAVGSVTGLTASNLDTTVSSRMATYSQPTGFLAATFPSGTVANTTNITAGTITTATNLTNAPTAGDFTATMKTSLNSASPASVTGAVGSVTGNVGGNVTGSVGSVVGLTASNLDATVSSRLATSGYTAPDNTRPANFTSLAITAGGAVTAGTVSDKTGYALTAAYDPAKTAAQVGSAMALNATGINSIWNEPTASHTTAGTTGKALTTAASPSDPWNITLPASYSAGTAGFILGNVPSATVGTDTRNPYCFRNGAWQLCPR